MGISPAAGNPPALHGTLISPLMRTMAIISTRVIWRCTLHPAILSLNGRWPFLVMAEPVPLSLRAALPQF